MRLRSDTLCWLRRASRDGSCRLVIQNGAGAPEAAAGQGNTTPFFPSSSHGYHTEHFATCPAKPARLSLTSFRGATDSSHASGLSGTASLGHVSSAARLLCSGDLSRVKECANSDCGAFFSDASKDCRRRCATTRCGNRIRVPAFYEHRRNESRSGTKARPRRTAPRPSPLSAIHPI